MKHVSELDTDSPQVRFAYEKLHELMQENKPHHQSQTQVQRVEDLRSEFSELLCFIRRKEEDKRQEGFDFFEGISNMACRLVAIHKAIRLQATSSQKLAAEHTHNIIHQRAYAKGSDYVGVDFDQQTQIISASIIGNDMFIPKMYLTSSDKMIYFTLQRRQFTLVVYFAMKIYKSQTKSLSNVGLFFRYMMFTYRHLYISLSSDFQSWGGVRFLSPFRVCLIVPPDSDHGPRTESDIKLSYQTPRTTDRVRHHRQKTQSAIFIHGPSLRQNVGPRTESDIKTTLSNARTTDRVCGLSPSPSPWWYQTVSFWGQDGKKRGSPEEG
ncbi:hypothetical protein LXL04_030399 [Taraxacum kok-saghyz]